VLCTGTGYTAGKDLGTLGNVLSELGRILIVNLGYFIHAELANLSAALHARSFLISHDISPS
jgi:hypothetical protein